jgi:hypothetical protein
MVVAEAATAAAELRFTAEDLEVRDCGSAVGTHFRYRRLPEGIWIPVNVGERMLEVESGVDLARVAIGELTHDDWRKITAAAARLADLPLLLGGRVR